MVRKTNRKKGKVPAEMIMKLKHRWIDISDEDWELIMTNSIFRDGFALGLVCESELYQKLWWDSELFRKYTVTK